MPKLLAAGHEVHSNNVPQEEAEELVENLEVKNVGYLFENAEKMDIQAERRNTREARERAEKAERRLESTEVQLESAKAQVELEKERAADLVDVLRSMLGGLVGLCREAGYTKEETRARLHDYYRVNEPDLDEYLESAWQGN